MLSSFAESPAGSNVSSRKTALNTAFTKPAFRLSLDFFIIFTASLTAALSGILSIIETAKTRAMKAVNAELINMYWDVGKYLSSLVSNSSFGDKIIDEVAAYISEKIRTLKDSIGGDSTE